MSILLFVIGAITLVLGALAIGFGIPINEFSFGNTLIIAGTTGAVGGMIVIGLGAVVSHLQRVAEVMAMRAPPRPARAPDLPEAGRAPAASPVSFPPQLAPELAKGEAPPVEPPFVAAAASTGEFAAQAEAPTLPNPDVAPPEEAEEVPPPPLFAAMPPAGNEPALAGKPPTGFNDLGAEEPVVDRLPSWLTPQAPPPPPVEPPRVPEEARFESVWPAADERASGRPAFEESEPAFAPTAPEVEPESVASQPAASQPADERRSVAVLKSGVVDGMAYTLYVDGSIEAELPQGTLRFASINELREHLEQTS
jgi:hypothetical protein